MKKHIMKVKKQFADQTFLRGDKLETSNEDLDVAQKRVETIRQSCQSVQKKMNACLQGAGQDSLEKRKKRMPAFGVAISLQESSTQFTDSSVLGSVLHQCVPVQTKLADELLTFETDVEKNILSPLTNLLENDIPGVFKLKKQLSKLCQDMESAKSKYEAAVRHMQQIVGPSTGPALAKATAFKDEYDELSMKVDLQKDALAGEMFALLSREPELSHLILQWYTLQADYHSRMSTTLETEIPRLRAIIMDSDQRPAYGCPIEEHLRVTNRTISLVIESCVCALLDIAMNEEGLFRIAGSATKVKRLKHAFDAGFLTMSDYRMDPHAIAGALKSYLRELPEPLMTFPLYDEWIKANSVPDKDTRLQCLWQVVNKLPEPNHNNLRYLTRFLAKLSTNSERNKMTPQNIAIVIAPNLIWSPQQEENIHLGMNMSVANSHSAIVDSLVTFADWFFPGEIDFYISTLPLPPPYSPDITSSSELGIVNSGFEATNGEAENDPSIINSLNTSPTSHSPRVVHRPGKKPAPPAPGQRVGARISPTATINRQGSLQDNHCAQQEQKHCTLSTTPPIMTRSATLDRPGKPKRNSLVQRQSHDNLSDLIASDNKEMSNYEKAAMAIRNRSLERPPMMEKPLTLSRPAEASLSVMRRGEKPMVPAKPPSLDNLIGSLNAELAQHDHFSQKEPIQFVDDSDDVQQQQHTPRLSSSGDPSSSLDDSNPFAFEADIVNNEVYESPPDQDLSIEQPPLVVANSNSASNFDKKWDFLTGGQGGSHPPERPPRTFPLPANPTAQQLKSEDYTATCGFSSERSSPVNRDTSIRSTRSASPGGLSPTPSKEPPQDDSPVQSLLPGQSEIEPLDSSADSKVPPASPTGSTKTTRPPRPQPPPPPIKPKPNHSSEDTRL